MFGLRMGSMGAVGAGNPLNQALLAIFRRPGVEAHAYIPGIGTIGGLALQNYIMEDGTQAASVDNPIGYMGDPIATVGPELVTNGDFSAGSTGWTAGTGWSIGGGVASAAGTTADGLRDSPSAYITGRVYQVSFDKTGTAPMNVYIRTSAVTVIPAGTTGRISVVIVAGTGSTRGVEFYVSSAVATTIGNISVKELVGAIPARQATTAKKPILRRGHVNRIRNSTMVGAVAGTPGTAPTNWGYASATGITRTIVGVGTVDGLTYLDVRFVGTASATNDAVLDFDGLTQVAALSGQTWTLATSVALVGGAWPVSRGIELRITERNSGGSSLIVASTDLRSLVTTASLTRVSMSRTFNQATTAFISTGIRCPIQSGDTIDFTIRVAAPQLETDSTANTYVPTTTAAASASTGPFWAEFDGTDFMSLAAVPFGMADDLAVVGACRASPDSTVARRVFSVAGASATIDLLIANTSGTVQVRWEDDAGSAIFQSGPAISCFDTLVVVSGLKRGNDKYVRRNGVSGAVNSTVMGAATFDWAAIGAGRGPSTLFIGGIYALIAIKGTITDAELSTIERWVAQASGITI